MLLEGLRKSVLVAIIDIYACNFIKTAANTVLYFLYHLYDTSHNNVDVSAIQIIYL